MLSKNYPSKRLQIAALLALLPGAVVCSAASPQDADDRVLPRLVSKEEGDALAQIALHHWPQVHDKPDCSHLVHDVYAEAGLDYEYATTNDLFDGIDSFRRVRDPQAGDLVVWQGHVGIVIDPEDTSFYSSVVSGFSVSSFTSSYWEGRGPRRFYRYKISRAQSARLLQRASGGKPYATMVRPVPYESTHVESQEYDSLEIEPNTPPRGARKDVRSAVMSENRIANAVVTAARTPTKEEIRLAFMKLSDSNSRALQQSPDLDGPIEIVDSIEPGQIEVQGSFGWVEIRVKRIAGFTNGRMNASNRTIKVRFTLQRQADGWTLRDPANCSYLLRPAAVRMITARLAELARDPDHEKDLKPLTRALGVLMADDRS
jgi:hypothetical protein